MMCSICGRQPSLINDDTFRLESLLALKVFSPKIVQRSCVKTLLKFEPQSRIKAYLATEQK